MFTTDRLAESLDRIESYTSGTEARVADLADEAARQTKLLRQLLKVMQQIADQG